MISRDCGLSWAFGPAGRPTVTEDGMKLLALVESADHVCCRYRIKAFGPALERAGWSLECLSLEHSLTGRLARLRSAANHDAVVLQRKLLPSWQLAVLRARARYLAFDFDDAVLYRDSYDRRGPRAFWRGLRFSRTVRTVDAVIAGNDYLADCALRAGARAERVHVIPTCVEPDHYPIARRDPPGSAKALELVWIGSSSTLQGIEQARPIWERIARDLPGTKMRVICDRFPEDFPLPIERVVWNEQTEAHELARGGVGVSVIPDDPWSWGKCGLKILQYQAAGLAVIASPVGVHRDMVRQGETGFLATSPEEWSRGAAALAADCKLRAAMGENGRLRVEAEYSVAAWSGAFAASATGGEATAAGRSWTIDRAGQGCARARDKQRKKRTGAARSLNQIGDR